MSTHTLTAEPAARKLARVMVQVFPRLLGALFVYAAIVKILNPQAIAAVLKFDHFPHFAVPVIIWTVIVVELLVGAALVVFAFARQHLLMATMIVLVVYIAQIAYLLIVEHAPSCGCLEGVIAYEDARKMNFLSLARNICLLLPTWWSWLQVTAPKT